jgi:hypothetical protein
MFIKSSLSLMLLSLTAFSPTKVLKTQSANPSADAIRGDYVEVRTASVFAGPCHYNGELVTEGRQAIMAWNITRGRWNGVDLAGIRAMASINCDDNLSDQNAARHTELVVDESASDTQINALADLIHARAGSQLGPISTPHKAVISFAHYADGYLITATGFASMTIHPMPNNECCTQPHLVWYEPLTPIQHRKVGYTEVASYDAASNGDQWERSDENSAFYGTFQFAGK